VIKEDFGDRIRNGPLVDDNGCDMQEHPYASVIGECLKTIVGEGVYKENITERVVPEWVNNGDEALLLLLIENCWKQICDVVIRSKLSPDEFIKNNVKRKENGLQELNETHRASACLYTSGGQGCKDAQGWHCAGIERFNELQALVKTSRATKEGAEFYARMLEMQRTLKEGRMVKKRKVVERMVVQEVCEWSDNDSEVGDREDV
jgi:hypothetical protein